MDKRIAIVLQGRVFTPQSHITALEVSQVVSLLVANTLRKMDQSEIESIIRDLGLECHFTEVATYREMMDNA